MDRVKFKGVIDSSLKSSHFNNQRRDRHAERTLRCQDIMNNNKKRMLHTASELVDLNLIASIASIKGS